MKKLFIIMFIFVSMLTFSKGKSVKILRTFYGHNQWYQQVKIQLVEYDIYKGFKIDRVLFMTEKNKYNATIKKDKLNYMWYIFVRCDIPEPLVATTPIWCLSVHDNEIGYITFVFNMEIYSLNVINQYFIEFDIKNLR